MASRSSAGLPPLANPESTGARNVTGQQQQQPNQGTTTAHPDQGQNGAIPGGVKSQSFGILYSPSDWTWEEPIQLIDHVYEPQGVLLEELQARRNPGQDFAIPQPVQHQPKPPTQAVPGQIQGTRVENAPPSTTSAATPRPLAPRASLKRKATSDSSTQPQGSQAGMSQPGPSRQRTGEGPNDNPESPALSAPRPEPTRSRSTTSVAGGADPINRQRQTTAGPRILPENVPLSQRTRRRTLPDAGDAPFVLPPRKVFPIQIGSELFRLSGASISSDAPSYFSQFFEEQLRQGEDADSVRTLYIDRDPITFRDISLHLQGYHIEPRDGAHFVRLFADAQFFSLPRLTAQLFSSTIYVRIGDQEFQIPRDLFNNPGDSPNYFSLGFAIFFSTPTDVFPGLNQRTLLRPPSILPPAVPGRSARVFADLLHVLKGYPLHIRNDEHRAELLRDARYFHLKGLEQKLIAHHISYNPTRQKREIVIRLEDVRQSGIAFAQDPTPESESNTSSAPSPQPQTQQLPQTAGGTASGSGSASTAPSSGGWVTYQRPYADSAPSELLIEISGSTTNIDVGFVVSQEPRGKRLLAMGHASFSGQTKARIASLFQVIANKMNVPVTQPLGLLMLETGGGVGRLEPSPGNSGISGERVRVRIGDDAEISVDGKPWVSFDWEKWTREREDEGSESEGREGRRKRRRKEREEDADGAKWVIEKGQWRIRVQPDYGGKMEAILCAVKLEAWSGERARNASRGFLG